MTSRLRIQYKLHGAGVSVKIRENYSKTNKLQKESKVKIAMPCHWKRCPLMAKTSTNFGSPLLPFQAFTILCSQDINKYEQFRKSQNERYTTKSPFNTNLEQRYGLWNNSRRIGQSKCINKDFTNLTCINNNWIITSLMIFPTLFCIFFVRSAIWIFHLNVRFLLNTIQVFMQSIQQEGKQFLIEIQLNLETHDTFYKCIQNRKRTTSIFRYENNVKIKKLRLLSYEICRIFFFSLNLPKIYFWPWFTLFL